MRLPTIVALAASLSFVTVSLCAETSISAPITGQPTDGNELGLFIQKVVIGVADLDKEAAWYERAMGFKVTPVTHRDDYDMRQVFIPGLRIDLLFKKGSHAGLKLPDNDKQGLIRVAFGTHDTEAAYKRVTAQGVKPDVNRNQQNQITSMHFQDPEGNGIEIAKR